MHIGLFGGTFDPIHYGHLRTALEVKEKFELDAVYFIPSALPPHKRSWQVSAASQRLSLLQCAMSNCPGFKISRVELQRSGPSYTIDTVKHFKARFPAPHVLYLILGSDAFLEIETWKSFRELLKRIDLIVMKRPLTGNAIQLSPHRDLIAHHISSRLSSRYRYCDSQQAFLHPKFRPIHQVAVTALDISATRIRQMVKEGHSIRFLVPEAVVETIISQGLYV